MAMDHSKIRIFLRMLHKYNLKGSILTIGVQDIFAPHEDIAKLLAEENFKFNLIPDEERKYGQSKAQKIFHKFINVNNPIHMNDLFTMLGFKKVHSLDFAENDNPTIIHDLNKPIPRQYHEKYDVVVDYGCSEHIFDVKQVFENLSNFVKVGGVIYLYLPMLGWHNEAFHNFQPPLYLDWFSANGYEDMSMYINFYPKYRFRGREKSKWIEYKYGDRRLFRKIFYYTHVLFVARKRKSIQKFTSPIMQYYLNWHQKNGVEKIRCNGRSGQESHYMFENVPCIVVKLLPLLIPVYKWLPNWVNTPIVETLIWIKNCMKLKGREKFWA